MNDLIKVTDANGVTREVNLMQEIFSLTHDMSSAANKRFVNFINNNANKRALEIVDSNNNPLSINDSANNADPINHLIVSIEASHSDTKINSAYYTGDSMLRDFESYVSPFQKTLIKNHNDHSEPIGRIVKADCTDSTILQGTKCIDVEARVSDKDAMEKILDGRYQTVSIGAYPKTITCQFCGAKILENGKLNFCGHWRGTTYKDRTKNEEKECTWKMEDLEYHELSVVNSPADPYAQIYKVKVIRQSDLQKNNNSNEGDNNMGKVNNELVNQVMGLTNDDTRTKEKQVNNENEAKTIEGENQDGEAKVVENEEVTKLKEENESLKSEMEALKQTNSALQTENLAVFEDNKILGEQVNTVCNTFKNTLIDAISKLDSETVSDSLTMVQLISRMNELVENTKKEVHKEENTKEDGKNIEEGNKTEGTKGTTMQKAVYPGLANNNDEKVIIDEADKAQQQETTIKNTKKIKNSYPSLIDSMVR